MFRAAHIAAASRLAAVALTLVSLFCAPSAVVADPVRLGTEGAFQPYNFFDRGGTLKGFDIDVGNAICAHQGLDCIWVTNEWDTIIPGLLAKRYDAILAGMTDTPGRREYVRFSDPYEAAGVTSALFIARHDFGGQDPQAALVAVQLETIHADYLRAAGIRFVTYKTALEAVEAVWAGTADMALGSESFLLGAVRDSGGVLRRVSPLTLHTGGTAVAFRPDDAELRAKFDAAIADLKADGTIERLVQKWFGPGAGTY